MDEELHRFINLKELLRNSPNFKPIKENYPDYLEQLLEKVFTFWDLDEDENALEQIRIFNSNFDGFHIGTLVEMAININKLDYEKSILYLNGIPETEISLPQTKLFFHVIRAAMYFGLWDLDLAREDCNAVIELDSSYGAIYFLRGICFALRQRHTSAIQDYKQALKRGYNTKDVIANLAYSYLRTGSVWKSLRLHKSIVDKFPDNDKVQYNTGICYKRIKRYSKAVEYFDKAVEINPENVGYKLTRGRVLMRLKRHLEAEEDLKAATEAGIDIASNLLEINSEVLQKKITSNKANKKIKEIIRKIAANKSGI